MSKRAIVLSLMLLAAPGAHAASRAVRDVQPIPVDRGRAAPPEDEVTHAPQCYEAYSNIAVANGFYFPAGLGVEVLDDLHLGPVAVSGICAFDLGYYNAGPGLTQATVRFYANNPGDDPPGSLLATFQLPGLPAGENGFHIEVPASALAQDVWMGVAFDVADAGLLLADPHWTGASDDWFFMSPPGQYYNFGGNPKSDFLVGVYTSGSLIAVPPQGDLPLVSGFRRDPWPNPGTRGVDLGFAIRDAGHVRAEVLDIAGRAIAVVTDRRFEPGVHTLSWDGTASSGSRVAAGVYLIRLAMPGFAGSRKFILVR